MNAKTVPAIPALYKNFPGFSARSVGFDHLFDMMDRLSSTEMPNYPPYNVLKIGDDRYRIDIAAAGFCNEELSVEQIKNDLIIKANSKVNEMSNDVSFVHRGLAMRDFVLKFKLADDVEVKDARFENGLLTIDLNTVVPEEDKPKQIPIL